VRADDASMLHAQYCLPLLACATYHMTHERSVSPAWSHWLQKWTDRGRAACFASSTAMTFRQFATQPSGKERWVTVYGQWEWHWVQGGTNVLGSGICPADFCDAIARITGRARRGGQDASWDPLPAFYNAVPDTLLPRPSGMYALSDAQATHQHTHTHTHELPDRLWKKVQDFWREWDREVCIRQDLLSQAHIPWDLVAASLRRSNGLLRTSPDGRLRRIARMCKLDHHTPLDVPDCIVYVLHGPCCPYVGQCGADGERPPIQRYAEHESRAKTLRNYFYGARHQRCRMLTGYGKSPGLARVMAQLGAGRLGMLPMQRVTRNNANSTERNTERCLAPTLNSVAPRGDYNTAFWEGILNHIAFPTRCRTTASTTNQIITARGRGTPTPLLLQSLREARGFVRPRQYERLFRVVAGRVQHELKVKLHRRIVLRTPPVPGQAARTLVHTMRQALDTLALPAEITDWLKAAVTVIPTRMQKLGLMYHKGPGFHGPNATVRALTAALHTHMLSATPIMRGTQTIAFCIEHVSQGVLQHVQHNVMAAVTRRPCCCNERMQNPTLANAWSGPAVCVVCSSASVSCADAILQVNCSIASSRAGCCATNARSWSIWLGRPHSKSATAANYICLVLLGPPGFRRWGEFHCSCFCLPLREEDVLTGDGPYPLSRGQVGCLHWWHFV